jgi:hypothetical protein
MEWGDWGDNPEEDDKFKYWVRGKEGNNGQDSITNKDLLNDYHTNGKTINYTGKYLGTRFTDSNPNKITGDVDLTVKFHLNEATLTIKDAIKKNQNDAIGMEFKLGGDNNDQITNSYMATASDADGRENRNADGIFYGDEGFYVGGTAFIKEGNIKADVVYQVEKVYEKSH